MQERRQARVDAMDARYEASLTTEQRRKREEYIEMLRRPAEARKLPPEDAELMFHRLTGKTTVEAGQSTVNLFGRIHTFLSKGEPQGFYMVGGTGCGKTTMANAFARTGGYRVVSCLNVVHEYEADKRNIDAFRTGSICFDDLGAEGKAYGNEVMADIMQSRYDLWRGQCVRLKHYVDMLRNGVAQLERDGIGEEGINAELWKKLIDEDREKANRIGQLCCYVDTLREDVASIRRDMIRTHITSNLDYKGIAERYGERVASRLHEMCRVVSFGNEPDHRVDNK